MNIYILIAFTEQSYSKLSGPRGLGLLPISTGIGMCSWNRRIFSAQRLYDKVSFSASKYLNSHTFSSAH